LRAGAVRVVRSKNSAQRYPPDEYLMAVPWAWKRVNQLRAENFQEAQAKGTVSVTYFSSPEAVTWPDLELVERLFFRYEAW